MSHTWQAESCDRSSLVAVTAPSSLDRILLTVEHAVP